LKLSNNAFLQWNPHYVAARVFLGTSVLKPHLSDGATCHNCGAIASGNFCAACGQDTTLHVASAREFLHEFIGHYIALEGKLWKTLALLLFRPGRLTTEYIAGRRARYVQPLRMYLTFSILFFALLKFGPNELMKSDQVDSGSPASQGASSDTVKVSTRMGSINPAWEARILKIGALPQNEAIAIFKNTFFAYVPYAMFCLMPVFALYLKILYLRSGRRYGEHMLFALHANAFAFLLLGVIQAVPWTWANIVLLTWLLAYLPVAMQRVYGGGKLITGMRWLVLMAFYVCTAVAVMVGTLFAGTIMF
jgi:hypothetical protein